MPARAPTKPTTNQETWKDWLGVDGDEPEPDELLIRDEIVKQANAWLPQDRKPISARDLRLWEQLGVLPRGIRRGHKGATRNVYPSWVAALARDVRDLQHRGHSLDEIKPQIRNRARIEMGIDASPVDEAIRARYPRARSPEDINLSHELVTELERLAEWRARLAGVPTVRIEVRVIGQDDRGTIYNLPLASHDD